MPIIKFQVKWIDNKEDIDKTFDVAYDSSTTIRNFIKDFARKINMTEETLSKKYIFRFSIRGFNNFIGIYLSNTKLGNIIKENQIIYLTRPGGFISIGGELSIVDVSKNKTKEYEQFENTPWYNLGGDGLNILSKCRNKECIAYNNDICINIGFVKNWDIFTNIDRKINCPCCGNKVKPLNIGFKNCSYHIQYRAKINGDYESRTNKGTTISDKFVLFDIKESGRADYYKLVFNIETI